MKPKQSVTRSSPFGWVRAQDYIGTSVHYWLHHHMIALVGFMHKEQGHGSTSLNLIRHLVTWVSSLQSCQLYIMWLVFSLMLLHFMLYMCLISGLLVYLQLSGYNLQEWQACHSVHHTVGPFWILSHSFRFSSKAVRQNPERKSGWPVKDCLILVSVTVYNMQSKTGKWGRPESETTLSHKSAQNLSAYLVEDMYWIHIPDCLMFTGDTSPSSTIPYHSAAHQGDTTTS